MYLYSLSKKAWTLLAQGEQYKNYAVIATFEGMNGLICLGDSQGRAELFYLGLRNKVQFDQEGLTEGVHVGCVGCTHRHTLDNDT
jgi:hypothetical protein